MVSPRKLAPHNRPFLLPAPQIAPQNQNIFPPAPTMATHPVTQLLRATIPLSGYVPADAMNCAYVSYLAANNMIEGPNSISSTAR